MHMCVCLCVSCYIPCGCSGSGCRHATTTIKSRVSFCCGRSAFLVAHGHVLCVSFLSLSLTHIARLQQLLESVKHTRQLLLLLSSYWYRNSHSLTHLHTLWHSLALEVIILARLLLLATRRRRNAATAELHGNVSKQQLRSNGTSSQRLEHYGNGTTTSRETSAARTSRNFVTRRDSRALSLFLCRSLSHLVSTLHFVPLLPTDSGPACVSFRLRLAAADVQ